MAVPSWLNTVRGWLGAAFHHLVEPAVIAALFGVLGVGVGSWITGRQSTAQIEQQIKAQSQQTRDQIDANLNQARLQLSGSSDQAQTEFFHTQQIAQYAAFGQNLKNAMQIIDLLDFEYNSNDDPPEVSASHVPTLEKYKTGMNDSNAVISLVGGSCASYFSNQLLGDVTSIYNAIVEIRDYRASIDPSKRLDDSAVAGDYRLHVAALNSRARLFFKHAQADLAQAPFRSASAAVDCA